MRLLVSLLVGACIQPALASLNCNYVKFSAGSVCKCEGSKCDSIEEVGALSSNSAALYSTTPDLSSTTFGDRLDKKATLSFSASPTAKSTQLHLQRGVTYQSIIGFGGALTDAAAYNIRLLTNETQQSILASYYSEPGLQYSLGRVPIASADFSTHSYSYDDVPNDFDLQHFDVSMDEEFKLPVIRDALATSVRPLALFGSAWSAPAWAKTSNSSIRGSLLGNSSNPNDPYFQFFANYYVKFLDEYEARGVKMWGVTSQNEPYQQPKWDSDDFTPETLSDWVSLHWGPTLRAARPDLKLIIHDDQRPKLASTMNAIMANEQAKLYVDGVGVHWYSEVDDAFPNFTPLNTTHTSYPELFILATEACTGYLPWNFDHVSLGNFARGMQYAFDIIGDLNNFAAGWTDWNIVLDEEGGPNHAKNFVDAPIIVAKDSTTVFYKQPMYYALGHFSKFLPNGSLRLQLQPVDSSKTEGEIIAFRAPVDTPSLGKVGSENIVIITVNRNSKTGNYAVFDEVKNAWLNIVVPANSIQTIVYNA